MVRGVAIVGGMGVRPTPTEPDKRLAILLQWSEKDPRRAALEANVKALANMGYPVAAGARKFPLGGYAHDDAVEEIARWTRLLAAL